MDIKVSVNIKEGGVEESVNFTVKPKGMNPTGINFKMSPSPVRIRVINLTTEAYNYMTSKESPEWMKSGDWVRMSKVKRLECHLNRLAENFCGVLDSYQVFDE